MACRRSHLLRQSNCEGPSILGALVVNRASGRGTKRTEVYCFLSLPSVKKWQSLYALFGGLGGNACPDFSSTFAQ